MAVITVLHTYPKGDTHIAGYVSLLTESLSGSDIVSYCTDDPAEYSKLLAMHHPDIVHMHGSACYSQSADARLVATPHGQTVTAECYVVIARSSLEQQQLQASHKRISLVRNPIITRTSTARQLASSMSAIYKRVMDSDVRPLMSAVTRRCMSVLLKAGICGDPRWVASDAAGTDFAAADWRQMTLYAYHESVLDTLSYGAQVMNVSMPDVKPATIPVFLPADYATPKPIEDCTPATLTDAIDHDLRYGCMLLLRLVELSRTLMRTDTDEARLIATLANRKQLPLFASLMQVMTEETLLPEGFMPYPAVDDSLTQRIRTLLTTHQKI